MLVAVLALVAALAGTAVADQAASTSAVSKKKAKKIARKQATKQIIKLAPGLSVDPWGIVHGDASTFASFAVDVNGAVRRVAGDVDFMSLSGITFRAE